MNTAPKKTFLGKLVLPVSRPLRYSKPAILPACNSESGAFSRPASLLVFLPGLVGGLGDGRADHILDADCRYFCGGMFRRLDFPAENILVPEALLQEKNARFILPAAGTAAYYSRAGRSLLFRLFN